MEYNNKTQKFPKSFLKLCIERDMLIYTHIYYPFIHPHITCVCVQYKVTQEFYKRGKGEPKIYTSIPTPPLFHY